jgi:hypothetical protein
MKGWIGYFRYANMQGKLQELDAWIRGRFAVLYLEALE